MIELEAGERFVTLAHELAHIFCGHLGACASRSDRDDDEGGWPDRRALGKSEKEVEAEATAFQVASRAGLVVRSAAYLAPHIHNSDARKISLELIVRATAQNRAFGKNSLRLNGVLNSPRVMGANVASLIMFGRCPPFRCFPKARRESRARCPMGARRMATLRRRG